MTDERRCIDARNQLNAALHGEGAVIDSLEGAVNEMCHRYASATERIEALTAERDEAVLKSNAMNKQAADLNDECNRLHTQRNEAESERDALRKDAERYRALRERHAEEIVAECFGRVGDETNWQQELDGWADAEAKDAALSAAPPQA